MNPVTTKQIFGSILLNAREKWMIVRYLKQQPSEQAQHRILETLQREDQHKKQAKNTLLKRWNEALSKLLHGKWQEKKAMRHDKEKQKDNAKADGFISDFFDQN